MNIRFRLSVWYTATLGSLLLLVGFASYVLIARTTREDVDVHLGDTVDAVASSLLLSLDGMPSLSDRSLQLAAASTIANHRYRDIGVAIFFGKPLSLFAADTVSKATRSFGGPAGWKRAMPSAVRAAAMRAVDVVTLPSPRERVMSLPVVTRRGTFVVSVSESVEAHEQTLRRVREAMLVGLPIALLLAMAGGYTLATVSLRPVNAMREQADQISEHNLHERLPVSRPADELARLSLTFNALLDRVEEAFEQRRRFTADASHELRTPVAVIIGESELALAEARTPDAYQRALQVIHGEARRLSHIVGDLFLLARADASEQPLTRRPLYVEELAGDCVDAMATLAKARQITLAFSPESEVPYEGDEVLLRRAVMNLIDNAVKYCPEGGQVSVVAEPTVGGGAVVRVSDSGPGIAIEDQPHIFDRFYRAVAAGRSSSIADGSGAGLGLPIARWIVQSHGGDLSLVESTPAGSTFEVRLPPVRA